VHRFERGTDYFADFSMLEIHAIILTLNEEQHIERCINSIRSSCRSITVVDSYSTDRTVELAAKLGAEVIQRKWINHADQVNFAITHLDTKGGWLFRIDADEVLISDVKNPLLKAVEGAPSDCDGLLVKRQIHFLGRRIRHGGLEPSWQLRLWKNGKGICESRWMDEHIIVGGKINKSALRIADINLNSVSWWIDKHNKYASMEMIEFLRLNYRKQLNNNIVGGGRQAKVKRFIKNRIYYCIPGGVRSLLYFLYRYVLRLGFLDGREGFYYHFLQAYWYRVLVDIKAQEVIYRIKSGESISDAIKNTTGLDVTDFD